MLGDLSLGSSKGVVPPYPSIQTDCLRATSVNVLVHLEGKLRLHELQVFVTALFILALVSFQRLRNPWSWLHPLPLALFLRIGNFFRGGAFSDISFVPGSLTAPSLFLLIGCCANPSTSSNHRQSSKNFTTNQRTSLDYSCKFQSNFGP